MYDIAENKVNPKNSQHKEQTFFFFASVWNDRCQLNLWQSFHNIHIKSLCLNLYGAICQLYLKTGKKN